MANRQKGESTITVDGVDYTLRLTTDATAQLEDACSAILDREVFFPEILQRVSKGSIKYMRLFVWACLREHHPDVTVPQAGVLIDKAGGVLGFSSTVQAISDSTLPDPEDRNADPPSTQAIPNGTGDGSSLTPAPSA